MEKNENILNEDLNYRKSGNTILLALGIISIIIGVSVFINYLLNTNFSYNIKKESTGDLNLSTSGQLGDFIGGIVGTIFSVAGFFLLYLTFQNQRESFEKERFENHFFKLVEMHRENVNEFEFEQIKAISYDDDTLDFEYTNIKGKKVAKLLLDQIEFCYIELRKIFSDFPIEAILTEEYLNSLRQSKYVNQRGINLNEFIRLNFCYLVVFFGVDRHGIKAIEHALKGKYKRSFYRLTLRYLALKPVRDSAYWDKWELIQNLKPLNKLRVAFYNLKFRQNELKINRLTRVFCFKNNYVKFYGGHQIRLGHYFRNLFQTINYVNGQKFLSFEEKYKYTKLLRAQLSTHEQALLFINSISLIGNVWEIDHLMEWDLNIPNKEIFNRQLITKYNLIKNIPGESLLSNISFRKYYPDIKYEGETQTQRKDIISTYYF